MAGSGVNKVILVGHLGAAPEMRYTQGGQAVANFRIATNDKWTDKAGQTQDRTEWHRIVVWGKLAELCNQYLTKGRQVYVEGRLQTREWMDKENHKNFSTEIVAAQVTFLGGRDGASAGRGAGAPTDDFGPPPPELSNGDSGGAGMGGGGPSQVDDIPF
jgi:single-strand DNA-binding protein